MLGLIVFGRATLRPDADRTWAGLHSVILIDGTVLLRPAIDRHLPEPLLSVRQLARWDQAMADLLRTGLFR